MWLFLINPLKLCSYGSWSLQGYVCKSSCCQCHIYIYSCLDIEMFKTLSVHFIDWWLCRSHSATQPLCQSGWCSHSATLPEWPTQPLSHSATLPERLEEQPLRHSATLPEWLEEQPLSHSVTLPEWLEQPLSHSATLPEWLEQPLSHSVTLPEWLEQPLSHSVTLPEWLEQPLSHSEWLSGWVAASATLPEWLSGWCENFRHCAFNQIFKLLSPCFTCRRAWIPSLGGGFQDSAALRQLKGGDTGTEATEVVNGAAGDNDLRWFAKWVVPYRLWRFVLPCYV